MRAARVAVLDCLIAKNAIFTEQKFAVPPQIDVFASMILFVSVALIGGGTAFRLLRENRLHAA